MAFAKPTVLHLPRTQAPEGYEESFDIINDGVISGGFFPQDDVTPDDRVGMYRLGEDLVLEDPNAGIHSLTSLLSGGFNPNQMVLETGGSFVYVGDGDIVIKS